MTHFLGSFKIINAAVGTSSVLIKGLSVGTVYDIQVRLKTKTSVGSWSYMKTIMTAVADIDAVKKKKERTLSVGVKAAIIAGCIVAVFAGFFIWLYCKIRRHREHPGMKYSSNANDSSQVPPTDKLSSLAIGRCDTAGKVNMGYEMENFSHNNLGMKRYNMLKYDIHDIHKAIPVKDFCEYVISIKSNQVMHEQFKRLKEHTETDDCLNGQDLVNSRKNRYDDVLPFDRNRFILDVDKNYTSDYINASFISSYVVDDSYIATQGPLPYTFTDFWRMLWQSNSDCILMLGQRIENGIIKCALYWPTGLNNEERYGRIIVRNKCHQKLDGYSVTTLLVRNKAEKIRPVKLFHFVGWSDRNSPSPSALLALRESIHIWHEGKRTPIIIHCRYILYIYCVSIHYMRNIYH